MHPEDLHVRVEPPRQPHHFQHRVLVGHRRREKHRGFDPRPAEHLLVGGVALHDPQARDRAAANGLGVALDDVDRDLARDQRVGGGAARQPEADNDGVPARGRDELARLVSVLSLRRRHGA